MNEILTALCVLGGVGLVFGVFLGVASIIFKVEEDEKAAQILEVLPGANCGGCGMAGCRSMAEAISLGEAKPNGCPVCNAEQVSKIAAIMGVEAEAGERLTAFVKCSGENDKTIDKYNYSGISDCVTAVRLGGGQKACAFACLGLGSCVSVCKFGAMSIQNGVAKVDPDKCAACRACYNICPKKVIDMVPYSSSFVVACSSRDKGAVVNKICKAGCIGCGLCAKVCPEEAITVNENVASIDYSKCVGCGACEEKCPKKVIRVRKQGVR